MEKFIPYEKLSKKEKRKLDLAKRQTWGGLNPVTRKPANSKAYNRKRTQEKEERTSGSCVLFILCRLPMCSVPFQSVSAAPLLSAPATPAGSAADCSLSGRPSG